MPVTLNGSCNCGAVNFTVSSNTPHPYMRCYCQACRKTAGAGGFAINIMAMAKARAEDYKAQRWPGTGLIFEALQQSQVSFEKFRHDQCEFIVQTYLGGNGSGIGNIICRDEMTKTRIEFLKSFARVN